TRKLGPRLSAGMLVARSPPTEVGATAVLPVRPVIAKPPPSQPAAAAAWAGTMRVKVASANVATPSEARERRASGRRVQVLPCIDRTIPLLLDYLQCSAMGVATADGRRLLSRPDLGLIRSAIRPYHRAARA